MTIQEAKDFFFQNLCSDYNMFNTNAVKYSAFQNLVDPDMKSQFCMEYMEVLSKRIYEEPEKSAFSFDTLLSKLGKRDKKYESYAERAVQIFEDCPFMDDFAKLMVMESMTGSALADGWGSGYSILCFYGDYAKRIRVASEQYMNIAFDKPVPDYYKSACHIPIEVMNHRADEVKTMNAERFAYVCSDEFKKKRNHD